MIRFLLAAAALVVLCVAQDITNEDETVYDALDAVVIEAGGK